MGILDANTRIMEIMLTEHGRKLLGQGKLIAKYYSFGDEEVDYQTEYSLFYTASTPSTGTLPSSSFIESLSNLTVYWNAKRPTVVSTNLISEMSNSASGKLRVFNTVANRPMTGTVFTSSAPWFSQSTQVKYFTDDSGAGSNVALSGVITGSQWHVFAVVSFRTTGSADVSDANTYLAPQIAGDVSGFWTPASVQSSGLKSYHFDGTARTSRYLPFLTGSKYILESSYGALSAFSLSVALNGAALGSRLAVSGNGVGSISTVGLGTAATFGGNGVGGGAGNSGAEIAEFICFSSTVSTASASLIIQDLSNRWDIPLTSSIEYATLPGLTVWANAKNGLTRSAGSVTGWLNQAPNKQSLIAASVITSSIGFGIPVPYFSGGGGGASYMLDRINGNNIAITGVFSSSGEHHAFMAVYIRQTGSDTAVVNNNGLMGDGTAYTGLMLGSSGMRQIMNDAGGAKVTNFAPYTINRKYIVESKWVKNAIGSGTMSSSFNILVSVTGSSGVLAPAGYTSAWILGNTRALANCNSESEIAEVIILSQSVNDLTASIIKQQMGIEWGTNIFI